MFRHNIYANIEPEKKSSIIYFCDEYKKFLSIAKTERMAVGEIEKLAIAQGFKQFTTTTNLCAGDKVYFVNKRKNIILYRIGTKDITRGLRILSAHLDSPRLDLKVSPLYENSGFALFDTHYYGNIKNYQYTTIPLAIHGVVCLQNGSVLDVHIGENEKDPILGISDIHAHLSSDQMQRSGNKLIDSEDLDVIVGSICYGNDGSNGVRRSILNLLQSEYGIVEEDFISAELEIVPSGMARDFGLDRSMISGYGQDDKIGVYTTLRAILDIEDNEHTACAIFVDKEEVGNCGATGAESLFFENSLLSILNQFGQTSILDLRQTLENSFMLSCDAVTGVDPIYGSVSDQNNGAQFNFGIAFEKYLGFGGKCGTNDASPEFFSKIRRLANISKIHYQIGEIGKVDQGGGGTNSYIATKYNMEVIDSGVPILNMHSPMEIASKADIYEAYLFYREFFINNLLNKEN